MEKKTAMAFGLIVLIIIVLPYYYKLVMPPQETVEPQTQVSEIAPGDSLQPETIPPTPTASSAEPAREAPRSISTPSTESGFPVEISAQNVTVETPLYHLTFSTRGGVLVGASMLEYDSFLEQPVELIREGSPDNLSLTIFHNGVLLDTRELRFTSNISNLRIPAGGEGTLILRAEDSAGAWIEKRFTFYADEYPFNMSLNAGGIAELDPYYELHWGSGMTITEADTTQDLYYAEAYAYMGGELEKFKGKGDKDLSGQATGQTEWVAQRNKYFEIAIVPQGGPGKGVRFGIQEQPKLGKHIPKVYRMVLLMGGQLDQESGQFKIFCGPLVEEILETVHPELQETMNWGWPIIEPFSRAVLWSLKAMHRFIPNYGVVLIIFSVLIKVLVWPLTQKSNRSMSRMSSIQPKIKEIQEKFKGQPEKLNKAMMQLYKDEGVNPLSGCWPTALQMPLLFALFNIFRSTIQLRGEPFILWITDLSRPDSILQLPFSLPLYGNHVAVLPILMAITQFMMSKVMLTDPKQKATMYMMPIFMLLIFNNFPSGLTMYYALFNLWSYLQMKLIKSKGALPTPAAGRS